MSAWCTLSARVRFHVTTMVAHGGRYDWDTQADVLACINAQKVAGHEERLGGGFRLQEDWNIAVAAAFGRAHVRVVPWQEARKTVGSDAARDRDGLCEADCGLTGKI